MGAVGGNNTDLTRRFTEECGLVDGGDLNRILQAARKAGRISVGDGLSLDWSSANGYTINRDDPRLCYPTFCRFELQPKYYEDEKGYAVGAGTFYVPMNVTCENDEGDEEDRFREAAAACISEFLPVPEGEEENCTLLPSDSGTKAYLIWACFNWEFDEDCEQWVIKETEDEDGEPTGKPDITTESQELDLTIFTDDDAEYNACDEPEDEFDEEEGTGKSYRLIGGVLFEDASGTGPTSAHTFAFKIGRDCKPTMVIGEQNLCSDMPVPCPCICEDSSSSSGSSSSGESSSESESESESESGSESTPSESDDSDSGSEKDTAIVKDSYSEGGYTALVSEESPYVVFNDYDFGTPLSRGRETVFPIDPRFAEKCVKNTLCVFASGNFCGLGARVNEAAGTVTIRNAWWKWFRSTTVCFRVTGKRKGFAKFRWPDKDEMDKWMNEERLGNPKAKRKIMALRRKRHG